MGVTPDYVGAYGQVWTCTLLTDGGADALTGVVAANISMILRPLDVYPRVDSTSAGAITIVSSSPAKITWQPTAADYATAGAYQVFPRVQFPSGPVDYDPVTINIVLH